MSSQQIKRRRIKTKWKNGNKEKLWNKNKQPKDEILWNTAFGMSCTVMFKIRVSHMFFLFYSVNAKISYKNDELASFNHTE